MKRYLILLAVALAVLSLAACGSAGTATPESVSSEASEPTAAEPTATTAAEVTEEAASAPTADDTQAAEPEAAAGDSEAEAPAVAEAAYPTPNPDPTCVMAPIPVLPDLPPVTEDDWVRGPEDAKITLIEYADFQCPYCATVVPILDELSDPETGMVRHVYRHFPLNSIHDKAMITGEAVEAAGAQGKFWEMYDLLYANQESWSGLSVEEMADLLSGYAEEIGLDVEQFDSDLESRKYEDRVMAGYDESVALGLGGTPSFIGDGIPYPTQQLGFSEEAFELFAQLVTIKNLQYDEPPPQVIEAGKEYQATIETEKGDIVIDLFADKAPVTVNNFVFLAQDGWYDDTTFHRVIADFMAQAGDPTGIGMAWPGYRCSDELDPDLRYDGPGVLGMANSGPDTNGSQFFITTSAQPTLDGKHSIFGEVVSGMDVVESLTERNPQTADPADLGDRIITIKIAEK
jgi:cyclophilin family peptidyl-prolyl cis-trans isomerase/protein-disulfide isomerase